MPKEIDKPLGAHSIWKSIFGGLILSICLVLMIWLSNFALQYGLRNERYLRLSPMQILLGLGPLPLSLWSYWAWRPKRKHALWHRWLQASVGVLYLSTLITLLPIMYWNALLEPPWDLLVNVVIMMWFITAWMLPFISYSTAKKLVNKLWSFNLRLLLLKSLIGTAGILGANLGLHAFRSGRPEAALFTVAFLSSFLPVFVTPMVAEWVWRYRPWAKEEE